MNKEMLLKLGDRLDTLSKEELLMLFNKRIDTLNCDWLEKYLRAVDYIVDFGNDMMYLWNNAGWDDKEDWIRKLDVIRKHRDLNKILSVVNMTEEEFFNRRG